MAHLVTSADIPVDGEHLATDKVAKVRNACGFVAAVGTVLSYLILGLGHYIGISKEFQGAYCFSWLFAFFFFITLTLGGCFWTLLHNVSNSGWGTSVRRTMENVGFVFPFMIVFAIPLLFPVVQKYLYEWMELNREAAAKAKGKESLLEYLHHHDHLLYLKHWYLNIPFWYGRFIFYFVAMTFVIWRLRKWSIAQDTDPQPGTERLFKARASSAWGIPVFAVVLTFCAIDWIKGLDYLWFSTMWGVYVFAGSALSSMALIVIVTILLRRHGYLKNVVGPEHDHLMGKLAFAFTIFWAYISFSQFFLYWYANITEETRYYILRNTENWNLLSLFLVFGHFAVPFLLLIRADLKKKTGYMLFVATYILFIHFWDVYHMVIPERGPSVSQALHQPVAFWKGSFLYDLIAFVIVGCGFVFVLLRNLTSAALYPHRDPRILESANVHN